MIESLLSRQILTEIVNIDPKELNSDIDSTILLKIKNKLEKKSINEGYIIDNSILFLNKSMGKLININNMGIVSYSVKVEADILTPTKGIKIPCYVSSFNKMGGVAYIKLSDFKEDYDGSNDFDASPFIIIIPNLESESIELNKKIYIIIMAYRIKYNSENIQVIGEYVQPE